MIYIYESKGVIDNKYKKKLKNQKVWMLVFDAVDDPQDLMRISNASPFFSKILHPRKTTHLFPEVCF